MDRGGGDSDAAEAEAYNAAESRVYYGHDQNYYTVHTTSTTTSELSSIDGPTLSFRISGIVGLCITGILWIIVSWRLLYHYSGWWGQCCKKREQQQQQHQQQHAGQEILGEEPEADIIVISHLRTDGFTMKRLLHIMLWSTMIVQGVGYADMVGTNVSNKLNYTLLDIVGRGIFEFTTFVIGTIHWFKVTSKARAGASEKQVMFTLLPSILILATIAVIVCSIFEAVVLLAGQSEDIHEFRSTSKIHRISLIVESSGWGVHALVISFLGCMVYKRIASLPTYSQVRSRAKRNIITKMIIPIIFCGLSYALRSAWMAADFASRILRPDSTFESGLGWWIGNCWIPTIIPSMMLLYSIRKRDREPGMIDGVSETLLQRLNAEPQDYDDPFQSFHTLIIEDENATIGSG
mmetsp:Transcript_7796/g.12181  ORF Transcript_7796/g.12181 Transcript_7796/m.12181 type:complete len:406 (+) Transcript_7796:52-1269(+)